MRYLIMVSLIVMITDINIGQLVVVNSTSVHTSAAPSFEYASLHSLLTLFHSLLFIFPYFLNYWQPLPLEAKLQLARSSSLGKFPPRNTFSYFRLVKIVKRHL